MDELKGWIGWVLAILALVMLALRESLRPWFYSLKAGSDVEKRVAALETKLQATPNEITDAVRSANNELREWFRTELNGIGVRLDRYEKLTLGAHDVIGDHRNRIEVLEEYGGEPTKELRSSVAAIEKQMGEQTTDLKWIRRAIGQRNVTES